MIKMEVGIKRPMLNPCITKASRLHTNDLKKEKKQNKMPLLLPCFLLRGFLVVQHTFALWFKKEKEKVRKEKNKKSDDYLGVWQK